jgi:transcription initiation protein SPT3
MQQFLDTKPNEDTVEILGFLAYEMVRLLTTSAVEVMQEEEDKNGSSKESLLTKLTATGRHGLGTEDDLCHLFSPPPEDREPIQASHVREAYRRLTRKKQMLSHFKRGLRKTTVATLII